MRLIAIVALSLTVLSASALPVPNTSSTNLGGVDTSGLTNGKAPALSGVEVSPKVVPDVSRRSTPNVDPSQLDKTVEQVGKSVSGKARRSTPSDSQVENAVKQVEGEVTGATNAQTPKVAGARRTTPSDSQVENAVKQVEGEVTGATNAQTPKVAGARRTTPGASQVENTVERVEGEVTGATKGQTSKGVAGARRTTPNFEKAIEQAESDATKATGAVKGQPKGVAGARRTTPDLTKEETAAKQVQSAVGKGTSVQTAKGVSARANGAVTNGSAGQLSGAIQNAEGKATGENQFGGVAVSDA